MKRIQKKDGRGRLKFFSLSRGNTHTTLSQLRAAKLDLRLDPELADFQKHVAHNAPPRMDLS